ncbi:MAG: sporulation protein YqfD [Clostridia bacterium]|nr:sporulation protein YqfD [Clostridia bacterium]
MRLPFCTHRFRLSGLNLERFLNLMKQRGIPLVKVHRTESRTLVCECYSADLPAVRALTEEKGWKLEHAAPCGLSAAAHKMKKRPGIPLGIAAMLVCVMVCSRFVWRVEVQGAGAYKADLVSFLQESGYHAGVRRTSVDASALENALLRRYPQIAWFHVYVANVTLVVEVSEGVPMPELPPEEPGDLVAERNGIIHSIRVYAGTPAVKAGDVVQKGDVLIRGFERGRDELQTAVRADGVVLARCWDSFTVTMPLYEVNSTETGREHTSVRIETPWFHWPPGENEPAYLASNRLIETRPVGGVYFPVFLQKNVWREVRMERVPRPEEEVRREAGDAVLKLLKTALFHDEIIDKWVDYCMIEDDKLAATATAERLVDIGGF